MEGKTLYLIREKVSQTSKTSIIVVYSDVVETSTGYNFKKINLSIKKCIMLKANKYDLFVHRWMSERNPNKSRLKVSNSISFILEYV